MLIWLVNIRKLPLARSPIRFEDRWRINPAHPSKASPVTRVVVEGDNVSIEL
jgi:hypothetical protein